MSLEFNFIILTTETKSGGNWTSSGWESIQNKNEKPSDQKANYETEIVLLNLKMCYSRQ